LNFSEPWTEIGSIRYYPKEPTFCSACGGSLSVEETTPKYDPFSGEKLKFAPKRKTCFRYMHEAWAKGVWGWYKVG